MRAVITPCCAHPVSVRAQAERKEREDLLIRVRQEAEAKAKSEWMKTEEKVRREAEERGMREGAELARREAAAVERRAVVGQRAQLAPDGLGRAVWEAAHLGDLASLKTSLKQVDVRSIQWMDSTPMHAACVGGHLECMQLLCDAGAAIDARNPGGRTPLYAACASGKLESATLLLRLGADVDAADHWGATPLIAAAAAGRADCAQLCIENGANVQQRGPHGTALDVARMAKHEPCTDLIMQHLALGIYN